MEDRILGLHHITAIAGDAQQNYDFYTKTLGLRLVKKTVNFDDPQTYHFYFGDEIGSPGTILTFFPWPKVHQGRNGAGMATEIFYSIPEGSSEFWKNRLEEKGVNHNIGYRFGEEAIFFEDPDGLKVALVVPKEKDNRNGYINGEIPSEYTIKGFHSVNLRLASKEATEEILMDVFGYALADEEKGLYRYTTKEVENAAHIDIQIDESAATGLGAGGTIHHIAFRVKDEETLMNFRKKISSRGMNITPKIDRDYFFSLYFREPGGVLFEIATDNPGFAIDENVEELGRNLMLPDRYESIRSKIEKALPELKTN